MLTEEDGVAIERFPTLAAQEAYSIEGAPIHLVEQQRRTYGTTSTAAIGAEK